MIKIRFVAQGANSILGGFSAGDLARVAPDFAKHLVEEAGVAEYVDRPAADVTFKPAPTKAPRPRKEKPE